MCGRCQTCWGRLTQMDEDTAPLGRLDPAETGVSPAVFAGALGAQVAFGLEEVGA